MTGILLAGGKSERMGIDKAFIDFQERKLYEYPLDILRELCSQVIISSSDKRFKITGHDVVPDEIKDIGPIGGIYTCLQKIKDDKALVMSCDIPFISIDFMRLLSSESGNYDITIGINKNKQPEPLIGIYNKRILKKIEEQIYSKKYKISSLFENLNVKLIDPQAMGWDTDELFFNVNHSSDLIEGRKRYTTWKRNKI